MTFCYCHIYATSIKLFWAPVTFCNKISVHLVLCDVSHRVGLRCATFYVLEWLSYKTISLCNITFQEGCVCGSDCVEKKSFGQKRELEKEGSCRKNKAGGGRDVEKRWRWRWWRRNGTGKERELKERGSWKWKGAGVGRVMEKGRS